VRFLFWEKLSLSLVNGMAEIYKLSWDSYNECKDLRG